MNKKLPLSSLITKNNKKILLIVLDGLGDLPVQGGKTPLEIANIPYLDKLAKESAVGLHIPVDYGITPGSGPGHLALFGYDPIEHQIGRGVLEALGLGIELKNTDVAIRGNFATVQYKNNQPIIIDRRAGRISTEENKRIVEKIKKNLPEELEGVKVIIKSGKEHRVAIVLRFKEPLPPNSDLINDTDPQKEGMAPLKAQGKNEQSEKVAKIINLLIDKISEILKDEPKANYLLLRGISQKPQLTPFKEKYGLKAVAIAVYPMYKGLAKLVGMDIASLEGETLEDQIKTLKKLWKEYDFFFFHVKKTDSYGEDGNSEGKIKILEEFDKKLPQILELKPDVLAITGDHSTPCIIKGHSWHPVPLLINSPYVLGNMVQKFTERECFKGELGIIPAKKIMNLLLAHSLRLKKYGA